MRPNRLLARAFLLRGARIWLLTRLIVTVVSLFADAGTARPSPTLSAEVIAIAVVLSLVDTFRHRERALLANLGIGPFALIALFALPAVAGEMTAGFCYAAL
jgi:asparagine N-glycosylation enzyme membrane subunit Stt3